MVERNEDGLLSLRELRKSNKERADAVARRYSLQTLADIAGVTQQTYLKYEEEPERMPAAALQRVADHFHVDIHDIIG